MLGALCCSCSSNTDGGQGSWTPKGDAHIKRIEVKAAGTLIEVMDMAYDETGRLISFKKTDAASDAPVFDCSYTYDGATLTIKDMALQAGTGKEIIATMHKDAVSYRTTHWQGWEYTTGISGGVATGTASRSSYKVNGDHYTANVSYVESYDVQGGNILTASYATDVEDVTSKGTRGVSDSKLLVTYSYSGEKDVVGFNAFIMDCVTPVWLAAGLPGCANLICDVTVSGDNATPVDYQMSRHYDYTMDSAGRVTSATRTDKSGNEAVCMMTYEISYYD